MSPLDRLLRDELNRLLDRVAGAALSGDANGSSQDAALGLRMEAAEARVTELRIRMLEDYERWAEALGEYGDLWALALLGEAEPGAAEELRAA